MGTNDIDRADALYYGPDSLPSAAERLSFQEAEATLEGHGPGDGPLLSATSFEELVSDQSFGSEVLG